MTAPNDSVAITPGSGATIATHLINSKEHQAVVQVDPDGHILGSLPAYRLTIPPQAVGASKVLADLWNGGTSRLRILSARALVNLDTAVTGTLGVRVSMTRTTAIGTGGTASTYNGTDPTAPTLAPLDATQTDISATVTARAAPTAGATAGAVLATRQLFTEETNAGSAVAGMLGAEFAGELAPVTIPAGGGLRWVQGTVASVGSVGIEVVFQVIA